MLKPKPIAEEFL